MDKRWLVGILLLVLLTFIAGCDKLACPPGCQPAEKTEEKQPVLGEITGGILIPPTQNKTEEKIVEEKPAVSEEEVEADVVVIEGELVKLSPKASDPEGDKLTFSYSKPLNDKGEWQTKVGDAGFYKTTVIASDGENEASKEITILVKSKNKAPVLQKINDIIVNEGEIVSIVPIASDSDGDVVRLSYSGWMTKSSYTTNYNDQGDHIVTVKASDGKASVSQDVKITVKNVNRAPVLEKISDIVTKEDDVVIVNVKASDPDNDKLTIIYEDPLNSEGTWVTEMGDAGIYNTKIIVSDGVSEVSQEFKIVVEKLNRAPKIEKINDITVNEGDTITLAPVVTDLDGDPVTVTYSGWMTSNTYKTNYNDQGDHIVTVTASDGTDETSQDVKIIVKNVNRPPVFTGI
jgi:hypothetical protein